MRIPGGILSRADCAVSARFTIGAGPGGTSRRRPRPIIGQTTTWSPDAAHRRQVASALTFYSIRFEALIVAATISSDSSIGRWVIDDRHLLLSHGSARY